ncbi:MAG: TVP38/TMEM64 family protein [Caldilineaceae bacterium]|nr:TVP38/TMEM64 family protein [Caldilineaceae bacterium]
MSSQRTIEPQPSWLAKHWQKVAAIGIWVLLVGALVWFMQTNGLTLGELFLQAMAWVETNPLAPLVYIVVYTVRPLTLFSSVLLTLSGGFLFGPVWGVIYTAIGANLSATVAYYVGRYFGQGLLESEASTGLVQRYARRMRENSFETVLIMRFIFLPYDLVNYLAGFLRIAYGSFILATIIGSIPGTIAFVLLGASLSPEQISELYLTGNVPSLEWRVLAISALMFVTSIALSRYFKRRERTRLTPESA